MQVSDKSRRGADLLVGGHSPASAARSGAWVKQAAVERGLVAGGHVRRQQQELCGEGQLEV